MKKIHTRWIMAGVCCILVIAAVAAGCTMTGWNAFLHKTIKSGSVAELYARTPKTIEVQDFLNEKGETLVGTQNDMANYLNNGSAYRGDFNSDGKDELWLVSPGGTAGSYTTSILKEADGKLTLYGATDGNILPVKFRGKYHFVGFERNFQTKFISNVSVFNLVGSSLVKKHSYDITYLYNTASLPSDIKQAADNLFYNSLGTYAFSEEDALELPGDSGIPTFKIAVEDTANQKTFNFDYALQITGVEYSPSRWTLEASDPFTKSFSGMDALQTNTSGDKDILFGIRFFKDKEGNTCLLRVSYPYFSADAHVTGELTLQLYKFGKNTVELMKTVTLAPKVKISRGELTLGGAADIEPASPPDESAVGN